MLQMMTIQAPCFHAIEWRFVYCNIAEGFAVFVATLKHVLFLFLCESFESYISPFSPSRFRTPQQQVSVNVTVAPLSHASFITCPLCCRRPKLRSCPPKCTLLGLATRPLRALCDSGVVVGAQEEATAPTAAVVIAALTATAVAAATTPEVLLQQETTKRRQRERCDCKRRLLARGCRASVLVGAILTAPHRTTNTTVAAAAMAIAEAATPVAAAAAAATAAMGELAIT